MSIFKTTLNWKRNTPQFDFETYDRTHTLRFEGGTEIKASSAPDFKGNAALVNPEEQLIAAVSSCHMLTFLAIAAKSRLTVDSYSDSASGELAKNEKGRLAITAITLRPKVVFSGSNIPDAEKLKQLHHKAHENCFIANSVLANVTVEEEG